MADRSAERPPVDFGIPNKASSAIQIINPLLKANDSAAHQSVLNVRSRSVEVSGATSASASASSAPKPRPKTSQSITNVPSHIQPPLDSTLDIYAANYIPAWLRAVNESQAIPKPCMPLNSINYANYISTFAGRDVLAPLQPYPSVSRTEVPVRCSDSITVNQHNYRPFWIGRQQNEYDTLATELINYRLYNVPIIPENLDQRLYRFDIPGLREHTPRIDLGDIVLVRPLKPFYNEEQERATALWYSNKAERFSKMAPAFVGFEYHGMVWGLSRTREFIVLRLDAVFPPQSSCNLIFVVQHHKCTPFYRAIGVISDRSASSSWTRSMLFPDSSDAVIQTTLSRGKFDLQWQDKDLNFEQKKAVAAVVNAQYGPVPYLISGPPGTGKTKTIVETALQLILNPKTNIPPHLLICAPSDAAADTLATRLSAHLKQDELFRLHGFTRSFTEVPDNLMLYTYSENNLFSLPPFHIMMNYKVIVTSCRDADILVEAQMTNEALAKLACNALSAFAPVMAEAASPAMMHWTAFLLDEAAQATEPECLIPLSVVSRGRSFRIQPQVIMAGDEHQLGPRLSSRFSKTGLEISLFQRLFERPFYASHPLSRANGSRPLTSRLLPLARPAFTNLIRNYRSHPAILSLPSALFYFNTLIPERTQIASAVKSWMQWPSPQKWPIMFRQNESSDSVEDVLAGDGTGGGTVVNLDEADIVLRLVVSLLQCSSTYVAEEGKKSVLHTAEEEVLRQKDIIVMSPFSAQVKLLRRRFRETGYRDVNVGPLEAFQGLEARIVIICTTRSYYRDSDKFKPNKLTDGPAINTEKLIRQDQARGLGIIDEPKRFNVAMTRAKEGLIVIGDARTLTCTGDQAWIEFISFVQRNQCYWDDAAGTVMKMKFSGRTANVGLLETAMNFSARIMTATGNPNEHRAIQSIRHLGMRMYDEEERMWEEGGMALPHEDDDIEDYDVEIEEAENERYPYRDGDEEEAGADKLRDRMINPLRSEERGSSNRSSTDQDTDGVQQDLGGTRYEDGEFDRDLETEFNREGCATQ